jgi:hypothetical protein
MPLLRLDRPRSTWKPVATWFAPDPKDSKSTWGKRSVAM